MSSFQEEKKNVPDQQTQKTKSCIHPILISRFQKKIKKIKYCVEAPAPHAHARLRDQWDRWKHVYGRARCQTLHVVAVCCGRAHPRTKTMRVNHRNARRRKKNILSLLLGFVPLFFSCIKKTGLFSEDEKHLMKNGPLKINTITALG